MYEKCKVVMLATNQKATNGVQPFSAYSKPLNKKDLLMPFTGAFARRIQNEGCQAYHLYIVSNDPIEVGDLYISLDMRTDEHGLIKCLTERVRDLLKEDNSGKFKKLIASTDSTLNIPSTSIAFIEKYIEQYNKGSKIENVLVEYIEEDITETYSGVEFYGQSEVIIGYKKIPKVSQDNTITIKKIKTSWSREEVDELLDDLKDSLDNHLYEKTGELFDLDTWKEENF